MFVKSLDQSISTNCTIVITISIQEVTLIVLININYIIVSFTLMFDWQAYLNSIGLPLAMICFNENDNNLQYK